MKKSMLLALCLAIFLALPSLGFAAQIWSTSPSTTFQDIDFPGTPLTTQWDSGLISVGPQTDTTLTLSFVVNFGKLTPESNFVISGLGALPSSFAPLSNGLWTQSFIVPTKGVYQFGAYLENGDASSTWQLQSATLSNSAKTPIPAAALLLGSGVLGLFGVNKSRRNKNKNV